MKDVLAHIARWQQGWSVALDKIAQGERPAIPDFTPNVDDPDAADAAYNAESVAQARDRGWEQVLARLRAAREQHDAAVRGLDVLDPDRYAEGRTAPSPRRHGRARPRAPRGDLYVASRAVVVSSAP